MSAPRHLWSGDWQDESSAHADDLAARRARVEEPPEPEPAPAAPRVSLIRRAIRRLRQGLRAPGRRRVRLALLAIFITLLGATAAYAVISDSSSSTKRPPAVTGNSGAAWLGVELANAPVRGALVSSVVRGSPAAKAGIRPGDLI
ncbi:MAG TPA: PDZ domain-containing protein, partial [Solirubrobacteraceae bacterium]|nr:PDZ domain-containing protein [Solirubrobacteraceae bacterium]